MSESTLSPENAKSGVLKLLTLLKYNRKAYTAGTLSKAAEVDKEVVELFLKAVDSFDYLKVKKSPSERIISFKFTPFSKQVYFTSYSCIIERGVVTHGEYRSIRQYSDCVFFKRRLQELEDCARNRGLLYVKGDLEDGQLCEEILKFGNLQAETPKEEDLSVLFPFVVQRVADLERTQAVLVEEVKAEERKNAENLKWFEEETAKAKKGERYRVVYERGRFLGTRTIHGPSVELKDSEWNGGNTYWMHSSEEVADYEEVRREVPDFPEKPVVVDTKAKTNGGKIRDIELQIRDLKLFLRPEGGLPRRGRYRTIKWEKVLATEFVRAQEVAKLEAQILALKAQRARL